MSLAFEILSSTEWKFKKIFEPNYFYCIDKTINQKIKAMKKYKSEIKKISSSKECRGHQNSC